MSVARTARRRRKQAAQGVPGLEQVYGKRKAPHYPAPLSKEKSAKKGMKLQAARQRGFK